MIRNRIGYYFTFSIKRKPAPTRHGLLVASLYMKPTNCWEGVLTGNSFNFGGSCGRVGAVGYGVVYFLANILEAHDQALKGRSVMITGSANVALHAAEKAIELGAKIITLSDSGGSLVFGDGLTEGDLEAFKRLKHVDRPSLEQSSCGKFHQDHKHWAVAKAEVLLPCATRNEVNDDAHPSRDRDRRNVNIPFSIAPLLRVFRTLALCQLFPGFQALH
ncbi:hypothetical protein [Marinobacter caseinilyticus]|uniref:hypothetical protein n=1 Tax=Marinobacter caseinilyticus TaxID=2692195 RepID=UPI001409D7CF|nr:hypothetical protein [Marinobacter caseinilyticus]